MAKKLNVNPWLSMWLHPRHTIKAIISHNPKYLVLALAMLMGIVDALSNADARVLPALRAYPYFVIPAIIIGGAIGGIITLYAAAFLLRFTGRLIGGKGSYENLRAAIAWAGVPNYWILPFDFLALILVAFLFSPATILLYSIESFASAALGVWSFVLMLQAVGEVHKFSAWKSLLAIFLAFAIVILIIAAIALPVIVLS